MIVSYSVERSVTEVKVTTRTYGEGAGEERAVGKDCLSVLIDTLCLEAFTRGVEWVEVIIRFLTS